MTPGQTSVLTDQVVILRAGTALYAEVHPDGYSRLLRDGIRRVVG